MGWLIGEMQRHRIPKLSLCGGEPLLHPDLVRVINLAGQHQIRCSITTNGMAASSLEDADLDVLRKYGTEINVSIDSFREEVQSYTRGVEGSVGKGLAAVDRFRKAGLSVTILTVITRFNYRDLAGFVREADRRGIRQVLFQPVIRSSNYPDMQAVADKAGLNIDPSCVDELLEILREILAYEKQHPIRTNSYRLVPWIGAYLRHTEQEGGWFFNSVLPAFYCRETDAIIEIGYDGGIQGCGLAPSTIMIQNANGEDLLTLWHRATGPLREDIRKRKYHAMCNGCCHHFSRNMLASVFRHPWKNRTMLIQLFPLAVNRLASRIM